MHKARLLHMQRSHPRPRRKRTASLTVDEKPFQNPKLGAAALIAYKTFADLAAKGSFFLVTIAAARLLAADAFGVFSLATTLGWLLAVVSDFGIQLHVARAIARRPDEAATVMRTWLRARLAAAVALTLLAIVASLLSGSHIPVLVPTTLFTIAYACNGVIEFLHYVYRGLGRTDVESSLTLWHRGATLVGALVALVVWRDVTALAAAMLAPAAITLLISIRVARRLTAETSRPPDGSFRHDAAIRWSSARAVWPIGAGIVLSAVYFRVDVFLVQLWSGTEAVGLYNAVFRLVDALRLFPAAVVAVALPSLCRGGDFRPLVRAAVPMTVAASGAALVLWLVAGNLIPAIYDARFAAAVPAFRILALAFPLMTLNLALTHQIVGWNAERAYAALCALALVVNLGLNARLIPAWSIDGAAWATVATEAFLTVGCTLVLARLRHAGALSRSGADFQGASASLPTEGQVAG
jgi:O-antigen/teichoic acid export membrane protein